MWFEHSSLRICGRSLEITTDSQYAADWVHAHFSAELDAAVRDTIGEPLPIRVQVSEPRNRPSSSPETSSFMHDRSEAGGFDAAHQRSDGRLNDPPLAPSRRDGRRQRVRLHRLDDFVVGPSNRMAYAAACRLVD